MHCRTHCGACCVAPSINQAFHGMPEGKPAGVPCVHLDEHMACRIFGDPRRPALCDEFKAEHAVCGDCREQALIIIEELELMSSPQGDS